MEPPRIYPVLGCWFPETLGLLPTVLALARMASCMEAPSWLVHGRPHSQSCKNISRDTLPKFPTDRVACRLRTHSMTVKPIFPKQASGHEFFFIGLSSCTSLKSRNASKNAVFAAEVKMTLTCLGEKRRHCSTWHGEVPAYTHKPHIWIDAGRQVGGWLGRLGSLNRQVDWWLGTW